MNIKLEWKILIRNIHKIKKSRPHFLNKSLSRHESPTIVHNFPQVYSHAELQFDVITNLQDQNASVTSMKYHSKLQHKS